MCDMGFKIRVSSNWMASKSSCGLGAFVAARSLQGTNQKMALGVKESHTFTGRLSSSFLNCHLSKASGHFHSSPPYKGRSLIGGSPLPSKRDLTRGRKDSDQRLRFVTQANLSPWYVKLTTVS